jgi:hypothetical protein
MQKGQRPNWDCSAKGKKQIIFRAGVEEVVYRFDKCLCHSENYVDK